MLRISNFALLGVLVTAGSSAVADTVEFRIVERTGQTAISSAADTVLDFAVQARVLGSISGLSRFSFNIVAPGESDAFGSLSRLRITEEGGHPVRYLENTTQSDVAHSGSNLGLPYQYTSLSIADARLNGLLNTSGGSFTNNPEQQEIGIVGGLCTGEQLVATLDGDFDGVPDYGQLQLNPYPLYTAAWANFGMNSTFVDVYRFKYRVGTLTQRTIGFELQNLQASVFHEMTHDGFVNWQPIENPASTSQAGISIPITVPDPGILAAAAAAGGVSIARGRWRVRRKISE